MERDTRVILSLAFFAIILLGLFINWDNVEFSEEFLFSIIAFVVIPAFFLILFIPKEYNKWLALFFVVAFLYLGASGKIPLLSMIIVAAILVAPFVFLITLALRKNYFIIVLDFAIVFIAATALKTDLTMTFFIFIFVNLILIFLLFIGFIETSKYTVDVPAFIGEEKSPEDTLKRRMARGEITPEEYTKRMSRL